jgi:hypothetical protein
MLCCFLPEFQERTSLEEPQIMNFPRRGGPSNLEFENMLTRTQSLCCLSLIYPVGPLEDIAVAVVRSGLKKNTTLRELMLDFTQDATQVSPILTSLRDHPLLRRLSLRSYVGDPTGLETLLLSDTSKITELDIRRYYGGTPMGLPPVLRALALHPTLTKLRLRGVRLSLDEARRDYSGWQCVPFQACRVSFKHTILRGAPSWRNLHQRCTTTRQSKC